MTPARIARALAGPLLAVVSYGWLDLLRHLPGPRLALVLPLRANGGAGGVSLLTVVLVATATFALLAQVAPPHRLRTAMLVRPALYAAFLLTAVALQEGLVQQARPDLAWAARSASPGRGSPPPVRARHVARRARGAPRWSSAPPRPGPRAAEPRALETSPA